MCARTSAVDLLSFGWLQQQGLRELGAKSLSSDDGEQLELFVAFASWGGGEDEQGLGLVLGEEDLAVEFDVAQILMDDR